MPTAVSKIHPIVAPAALIRHSGAQIYCHVFHVAYGLIVSTHFINSHLWVVLTCVCRLLNFIHSSVSSLSSECLSCLEFIFILETFWDTLRYLISIFYNFSDSYTWFANLKSSFSLLINLKMLREMCFLVNSLWYEVQNWYQYLTLHM